MVDRRDATIRAHFLNVERTAEQRRKDLVIAFDEIYDLKCKYRSVKIKLWVITLYATALTGVNFWLANHLYDCVAAVRAIGH
jgi:hypothetical protein